MEYEVEKLYPPTPYPLLLKGPDSITILAGAPTKPPAFLYLVDSAVGPLCSFFPARGGPARCGPTQQLIPPSRSPSR